MVASERGSLGCALHIHVCDDLEVISIKPPGEKFKKKKIKVKQYILYVIIHSEYICTPTQLIVSSLLQHTFMASKN